MIIALATCMAQSAWAQLAPPLSEYVREVFQDRSGTYWFGTNGEGVARHDGSRHNEIRHNESGLRFFNTTDGLGGNAIRGMVQTADGALWFATDGGVSRFLDGRWRTLTVADGLSDPSIWSILLDRSGTIWVGTHEGVCRLVGERFVAFPLPRIEVASPESRFSPKVVFAMCEDRAGAIWFGTDGEGVHRFDGKSFVSYASKDDIGGLMVRAIHEDRRGRIWIGSDGGGVTCFDGTAFRTYTSREGLSNDRVFEILEDRAGTLWVSTLGAGVARFDGTAFAPFGHDRGLSLDEVTCACGSGRATKECHGSRGTHVQDIFEDQDGTLWFGCSGGLFRYDGASFTHVTRNGPWPRKATPTTESPVPAPLAPFARMIGGEWRVTFASGTTQFDRWRWGPGRHSIISETFGTDAEAKPWRVLTVYFVEPGSDAVRVVSSHPPAGELGRGMSSGTAVMRDASMTARTMLRQSGRPDHSRSIETLWDFRGPDAYRSALAEDGGRGFEEMVAWEYTRSRALSEMPAIADDAAQPAGALSFLASTVAHRWQADVMPASEVANDIGASMRTDLSVIPYLQAIHAQVTEIPTSAGLGSSIEAFVLQPVDRGPYRVLVLTASGCVGEGTVTITDDRSLDCSLEVVRGKDTLRRRLRVTLEPGDTMRTQVWSADSEPGALLADLLHRHRASSAGAPSSRSAQ